MYRIYRRIPDSFQVDFEFLLRSGTVINARAYFRIITVHREVGGCFLATSGAA